MICKNCEVNFEGNFCTTCGQNSEVRKIDFNYLMNEIPNSLLQIDKGFLFTVKKLSTRPGHRINAFLKGKRKPYYKPLAFFLVTSTVYIILAYLWDRNTFIDDLLLGFKQGMDDTNDTSGLELLNWFSKNQTYFILLFLPLFSLASYLAFIKSKYNYFEHLVINLYITGYQMIIYLVFSLFFIEDNILLITPIVIGLVYNFWAFNQLFYQKKTFNKTLLIILTYFIFIIELLALLIITATIKKIIK